MRPLVSICIPTYNRANLLEKAIASALSQTLSEIEIVVVDNHSEDDTQDVVARIKDDRVRYHRNEKNIGMVANFNKCLKLAKGKYINILHSDDHLEPEIVEYESQFLEQNQQVGMVYTAYCLDHELSKRKKRILPHEKDRIFAGTEQFDSLIRRGNYIAFSSVMLRKATVEHVGEFNESLLSAADLELWLRISLYCPVGYLAKPLAIYRFHPDMDSFDSFRTAKNIDCEWKAVQVALGHLQLPDSEWQRQFKRARKFLAIRVMRRAFFHADKGMKIVREWLTKAVQIDPTMRFHPACWFIYIFSMMGDRSFSILNRARVWILK